MRVRANREMMYRTRRMQAGDEFEATDVDARYLMGDASVSEAGEGSAALRRGRPPKASEPAEPQPQASEHSDEYYELTVGELRVKAEENGIDLDHGYMRRDQLVALLREAGVRP